MGWALIPDENPLIYLTGRRQIKSICLLPDSVLLL